MPLFGEAPANRTASWEPPPTTRGSIQILSSCLITLGLCIWTAVHLNIPEHINEPERKWWDPRGWVTKQQWRKVTWLILGVLAPEMECLVLSFVVSRLMIFKLLLQLGAKATGASDNEIHEGNIQRRDFVPEGESGLFQGIGLLEFRRPPSDLESASAEQPADSGEPQDATSSLLYFEHTNG